MLQLLVVRHAKSDWDLGSGDDHGRPLAERGVKGARRMGRLLTQLGAVPDLVMTSTAARAVATADLMVRAGEWRCAVESVSAFYGGGVAEALDAIAGGPKVARLAVVGHEPTWSELVSLLVGGGSVRMATAAVACIDFELDAWSDIKAATGRLAWLVGPKLAAAAQRSGAM